MIYTLTLPAEPVDEREIMRYMGCLSDDADAEALIRSCVSEALPVTVCKVCYGEFDMTVSDDTVDFGFATVRSCSLSKHLSGCRRAVIFAATAGIGIDRLIARYGAVSPARALCMQCFGAERIESICDAFEEKVTEGRSARSRFSPGYGDLSLDFQRQIFCVLDCSKKIGVTLNQSLLMSPTKSVTAIIGIE